MTSFQTCQVQALECEGSSVRRVIPINGVCVMGTCYDPCNPARWNDEIILKDNWTKGLGPHGGF